MKIKSVRRSYLPTLLLFLVFCGPLSIHAQSVQRIQRFKASAFAALNLAQIDGDGHVGYHRLGPMAGLRGVARFHRKLEFSMELMYSQRGAKPSPGFTNSPLSPSSRRYPVNIGLSHADAGFFVNFLTTETNDDFYRFHLQIGLIYSRLIRSEVREILNPGGSSFSIEAVQDDFRKNLVNLGFGTTVYLWERTGILLRHSVELTPLYLPPVNADPDEKRLLQYWLSIGLVYNFY